MLHSRRREELLTKVLLDILLHPGKAGISCVDSSAGKRGYADADLSGKLVYGEKSRYLRKVENEFHGFSPGSFEFWKGLP
jgi:hypothetical protein